MEAGGNDLQLLSLKEAAGILSISNRTLLRLIKRNGMLAFFKVGGQWRIRESSLKKWVEDKEEKL